MKNSMMLCVVVTVLSTSQVFAGGLPEGVYAGVSVGQSQSHADTDNLVANPAHCSVAGAACQLDKDGKAWSVYAGYPITDALSVEGEYTDLGRIVQGHVSQGGVDDHYSQKTTGVGVSVVGKVKPLVGKPLSLYGKAGAFHWVSKADASFSPTVTGLGSGISRKENGTVPTIGLGTEYAIGKHWAVRTSWQRYFKLGENDAMLDEGTSTWRTLKTDVDTYTLGATYHF